MYSTVENLSSRMKAWNSDVQVSLFIPNGWMLCWFLKRWNHKTWNAFLIQLCALLLCSRKKGTCISGFMSLTRKWKRKQPRSATSSQPQVVIYHLSSADNSHLCEDKNYNLKIQTQQRTADGWGGQYFSAWEEYSPWCFRAMELGTKEMSMSFDHPWIPETRKRRRDRVHYDRIIGPLEYPYLICSSPCSCSHLCCVTVPVPWPKHTSFVLVKAQSHKTFIQ
jgi:hypothetical protein